MTHSSLSGGVRQFIAEHIDSAEGLEILLHLYWNPERSFTAEELGPAVYTVPAAALLRLERMVRGGLVGTDGAGNPRYRFAPATPALAERVVALAAAYRENRVAIIQAVFQSRKSPAQTMADAFRLRGG